MNNLTKEELEYHLCDIGREATIQTYHITDKEIDSMLTAKVYGESVHFKYVERKRSPRLEPIQNSDNVIELFRIIKDNYNELHKYAAKDKWTINSQSLTKEDILQNTLLSILKNAGSFIYESDEITIHMINKSIKNNSINELRDCKLTKEKTRQFKQLFLQETGEQPEINDGFLLKNPLLLDSLSTKQRQIFQLIADGKNSREISDTIGIDIKSISDYKKRIGLKINKFFLKNTGSFV